MPISQYKPDWSGTGISDEYHRFFVLLWKEALDSNTVEMWQPRAVDVPGILEELSHGIHVATFHDAAKHHLPHILDELRHQITSSLWHRLATPLMQRLVKSITDSGSDYLHMGRLCEVARAFAPAYRDALINNVRSLLIAHNKPKKHDLEQALHALFTRLIHSGYAIPTLVALTDVLTDPAEPVFVARFDAIRNMLLQPPQRFQCVVRMSGLRRLRLHALTTNRLAEHLRPDRPLTEAEEKFYHRDNTNKHSYFSMSAFASDPIAAATNVVSIAEQLASHINIHSGAHQVLARHDTVLVQREGYPQQAVHLDRSFHHERLVLGSRVVGVERTERVLASLRPEDANKISAALEYLRLGERASSDESRLMLLWVALESLARQPDGHVLAALCNTVPYISALARVKRIVHSLCRTMHVCNAAKNSPDKKALYRHPHPSRVLPRRVLTALTNKSQALDDLYSAYGDNEIVRFRIHRTANHVLQTPLKVAVELERHRQSVDWQLRRIYRRRNDIAHGETVRFALGPVVRHLHTYFIIAIESVLEDLSMFPAWSVSSCLEHRKLLYQQFQEELRSATSLTPELFAKRTPALI